MGKIKRMDQIRQILEAYIATNSLKATARRLQVSKNTVKVYIRIGKAFNEDLSQLLLLSESAFLSIFYPSDEPSSIGRQELFSSKIDYWIKELRRVGVSRYLLWQEYRQKHPDGYGYSQFCERLGREVGRRDLTLTLTHPAGQSLQVDFAGKKMRWVDVYSGEVHECEVLVAVFPHSQYTFAIALTSQKIADFVHGLNLAFLFFGGLPQVILSDNLKSYVIKADKYDPAFNELCVQLGAHYQLDLSAARVGKPKDKASVENMVSNVYRRIYAPLRNEIFHSLKELNAAISQQLSLHNNTPYQQKTGTRQEIFYTYELPLMRGLPNDLFEIKKIAKAQVRRDYHVYLSEEKNYYSVPYQYVGQPAIAIYTAAIVQIYIDNQRVATHERLLYRDAYQHQTNPEHMPKSHSEWKKARGYNAAYFLAEAEKIGPATSWAVEHILVSRIHETQSYNSCQGLLRLVGKYSNVRLENAAGRCQKVGKASYSMIKRILIHKLDMESDQLELFNMPQHDNIRGPEAYQ